MKVMALKIQKAKKYNIYKHHKTIHGHIIFNFGNDYLEMNEHQRKSVGV